MCIRDRQTYHVVHYGNKATRRDYSKVSSGLDLPDLVEIQTAAFDWFLRDGIKAVSYTHLDVYKRQVYQSCNTKK